MKKFMKQGGVIRSKKRGDVGFYLPTEKRFVLLYQTTENFYLPEFVDFNFNYITTFEKTDLQVSDVIPEVILRQKTTHPEALILLDTKDGSAVNIKGDSISKKELKKLLRKTLKELT